MNLGIETIDIDVQCPTHGAQKVTRIKSFDGAPFSTKHDPQCPVCRSEAKQAQEAKQRAEERLQRIQRLVERSCIPFRYANTSFADYRTALAGQAHATAVCSRYVETIANKNYPGWLVLTGRPGTGKTMLLSCMARAMAEHLVASRYVTQSAMGREFRGSYQRDAERTEADLFDHFTTVPLLLVDELGAGSTEHTDRLLFEVLDERYANEMPTVIATNHPRAALESVLGERLHDRLREEAAFVAFDWESGRQPAGLRKRAA